jgi:hypothetical protein
VKEVVEALVEKVHMKEKLRKRRLSAAACGQQGIERPCRASARLRPLGQYKELSMDDSSSSSSEETRSEQEERLRPTSDETELESDSSSRASSVAVEEIRATLQEVIDAVVSGSLGRGSGRTTKAATAEGFSGLVQVKIVLDATSSRISDHKRLTQLSEARQAESPGKRGPGKRSRSPSERPPSLQNGSSPSRTPRASSLERVKNGLLRSPLRLRARSPSSELGRMVKVRLHSLAQSVDRSPVRNARMSVGEEGQSLSKPASSDGLESAGGESPSSQPRVKKRLLSLPLHNLDTVAQGEAKASESLLDTQSKQLGHALPVLSGDTALLQTAGPLLEERNGGSVTREAVEILKVKQDGQASDIVNIKDVNSVGKPAKKLDRKTEIRRLPSEEVVRQRKQSVLKKAKNKSAKRVRVSLAQKVSVVERLELGESQVGFFSL